MRLSCLLAPLCATFIALEATPASALSCIGPPWEDYGYSSDRLGSTANATEFPVDVVWFEMVSCAFGFDRPGECTLTRSGEAIPVEVQVFGGEGCSLEYGEYEGDNYPDAIVHYVPTQPLTPGATYTLACGTSSGPQGVELKIRGNDTPASAASLDGASVEMVRSGDGCCSFGNYLELRTDTEAAFLREGGYVEALYPNGQVVAVYEVEEPGVMILPETRGPLELTPVAADGTRGETLRLEEGEIDRELVYIPCSVSDRPPPLALWLLAPLVWIGAHGRRRRAAARAEGGAS